MTTQNFQIIGFTDKVNECECCGKTELKGTYCINIDDNEFYYGSTCAKRNVGLNSSDFNKKAKEDKKNRLELFKKEFSPIQKKYSSQLQSLDWNDEKWDLLNDELNKIKVSLKNKYKLN